MAACVNSASAWQYDLACDTHLGLSLKLESSIMCLAGTGPVAQELVNEHREGGNERG
jgi:hypothetical protein